MIDRKDLSPYECDMERSHPAVADSIGDESGAE
jgi:hypothetical protein